MPRSGDPELARLKQGPVVHRHGFPDHAIDAGLITQPLREVVFDNLIGPGNKDIQSPDIVDEPVAHRVNLPDSLVELRLLIFVDVDGRLGNERLLVSLWPLCKELFVLLPDPRCDGHLFSIVKQHPSSAHVQVNLERVEVGDESVQVGNPALHVVLQGGRQVRDEGCL